MVFVVALFCIPESPLWLVEQGTVESAQDILQKVGGSAYAMEEPSAFQGASAEIFSNVVRGRALGLATLFLWGP